MRAGKRWGSKHPEQDDAPSVRAARQILADDLPWEGSLPVDVGQVLDDVGMGEPYFENDAPTLGELRVVGRRWHPVVRRTEDRTIVPQERFVVARLVGRALVASELDEPDLQQVPEDAYDDFARRLLLPDEAVLEHVPDPVEAEGLVLGVRVLARWGRVSLALAAQRVCDLVPGVTVWGLRQVASAEAGSLGLRVDWLVGPDRCDADTGDLLSSAHELAEAVLSGAAGLDDADQKLLVASHWMSDARVLVVAYPAT